MEYITLLILAFGLSMDAFAVSVCSGLGMGNLKMKRALFSSGTFGVFQGIMPLIGYYIGFIFLEYIEMYLKYISLALLAVIGVRMIIGGVNSLKNKEEKIIEKPYSVGAVFLQGIATSLDALAVGVSLLSFSINIWICASIISVVTFAVCLAGVIIGAKAAKLIKNWSGAAEIAGGLVLIIIGIIIVFR